MPKRTDIQSIMIIGAGPIVIGQACEFDYSGTQAVKALKDEGYKVILVNSNPATIMTDPEFADRTYIEPLVTSTLRQIIERERPDALLPTVGGQTALNAAVDLSKAGVLEEFGVELIGANLEAIQKGEDRLLFREAMDRIGLKVPHSGLAHDIEEAMAVAEDLGLPVIIRPAFTLGGTGGGVAYNREEFRELAAWGLDQSPVSEILIEESVIGWKEFELEVVRDTADNVIIICSIENLDPMGVHTGDSITVAPAQTLTDKEYQRLRDAAIRIIREIGVDTGGSNIQFAINPDDGRLLIIEMNPRVSRSSALASKATGFPIAKIAAKLAVGYTLDELTNDITGDTPASFEPTIDYVVTKIPRFAFEKFPGSTDELTTQMRSVGEIMSIGRTFAESLQKGVRSLEIDSFGFDDLYANLSDDELLHSLRTPNSRRIWMVAESFRRGTTIEVLHEITKIDPWFLSHISIIIEKEKALPDEFAAIGRLDDEEEQLARLRDLVLARKQDGFSDRRLADLLGKSEDEILRMRKELRVFPKFRCVDTCGGEFVARTPYLYSSYDQGHEPLPPRDDSKRPVVILGGGPNRIGQGIEFDYCCVHACFAIQEAGHEAVMVNCNPETVSTDYDTSDRLYFEPLTEEDVLHILEAENPRGVILQFGGQTPLKLAMGLAKKGIPILGTPPEAIDRAEDRDLFNQMCEALGIRQPPSGIARSIEEALQATTRIGYPVVVRPSYVLGGRAMEIVYNDEDLHRYMREAVQVSQDHPVLIDHFLEDALEIDVDVIYDGETMVTGGIMEHIEQAGIHSGDSACILPPINLSEPQLAEIRDWSLKMAHELGVIGLMNVQYALQNGKLYVLEVNPRASRTVPFVSKSTGLQLAKIATHVMLGSRLADMDIHEVAPDNFNVKETIFPFNKFPGVDTLLGPEMRSTGEVMGIAPELYEAFAKAQAGVYNQLPASGAALVSIADKDKERVLPALQLLQKEGFTFFATSGTAAFLKTHGIEATPTMKVSEGRPHVVDIIKNGDVSLVLNTPKGGQAHQDAVALRSAALKYGIPYFTTAEGALAAAHAITHLRQGTPGVVCLQDVHD